MSAQIPDDQFSAIKKALFEGRKIEAIKLYRKSASIGLAEAKNAVDKLEQELRTSSPESFKSAPSGKGCFAILVGMCALGLFVVALMALAF
jgi:hypothetical protein